MDIIYMSDAMAYQSLRGPLVDRHDYQWSAYSQSQQGSSGKPFGSDQHSGSGEKCKICSEKQRRGLGSYIRKKSTCQVKIVEEEEDC